MSLSISIVIPVYNESDTIERCLNSVLEQTVAPDQIVIVNNMSTDDTVEIVMQYMSNLPQKYQDLKDRIHIIDQNEYQGIAPTRNAGFNYASTDIIGRIDSDSIISPDWVSTVLEYFKLNAKTSAITGPVTYYDMPFRKFSLKGDRRLRKFVSSVSSEFTMLFGTNMALRRDAWDVVKDECCLDLNNEMHEDVDLGVHLALHKLRIDFVDNMVAGMSARRIEDSLSDFSQYQKRNVETFRRHNIRTVGARYAKAIFMTIYFPLHLLRPIYLRHYHKVKNLRLNNIWY